MKKKILLILATVLFIFVDIALAYFFFFKKTNPPVSPEVSKPTESQFSFDIFPSPSPAPKGEFNILLLGRGDPAHEGSNLTDSIMVLHLKTNSKTAALIFIPRDLWVGLKINEAYTKKGFEGVEQIASFVTGLSIQNAILADFNGFTQIINILGGIDVAIEKTFDDYYYPIAGKELDNCEKSAEELVEINATLSGFELEKQYTCRYENLHFDAGKTHMDGATALKYARSRHSAQAGSDFARGGRQQAILIGLKDKLINLEALKNVDKLFEKMIKLVKTDLDLETTKLIASLIINPKEYEITQIIPSEENVLATSKGPAGQFILLPKAGEGNWSEFQEFIKKQI